MHELEPKLIITTMHGQQHIKKSQYEVLSKFFIEVRRRTLGIDWLGPPTMHAVYQRDGLHYVLRLTQKLKNTCWRLRQWKQYSPQPITGHNNGMSHFSHPCFH